MEETSLSDMFHGKHGKLTLGVLGAIASLLMLYFYFKGKRTTSSTGVPANTDLLATQKQIGTLAAAIDAIGKQTIKPPTSVEFKYSVNNSHGLDYKNGGSMSQIDTRTTSGGGGGGLNVFGLFTLGASGHKEGSTGSSFSSTYNTGLATTNSDTFSADTILSNATDSQITAMEAWLTGLTGTYEQRMAAQKANADNGVKSVLGTGAILH